jgi:hypothetical protein
MDMCVCVCCLCVARVGGRKDLGGEGKCAPGITQGQTVVTCDVSILVRVEERAHSHDVKAFRVKQHVAGDHLDFHFQQRRSERSKNREHTPSPRGSAPHPLKHTHVLSSFLESHTEPERGHVYACAWVD